MREIHFQNTYLKDFKLVKKQGWDLEKIKEVVITLQTCDILEPKLKRPRAFGRIQRF